MAKRKKTTSSDFDNLMRSTVVARAAILEGETERWTQASDSEGWEPMSGLKICNLEEMNTVARWLLDLLAKANERIAQYEADSLGTRKIFSLFGYELVKRGK